MNIPYDLIDAYYQYVLYRNNQTKIFIYNDQLFICICKSNDIFGRYCEYKVPQIIIDEDEDVSDFVPTIVKARTKLSPWERSISCYNLLPLCHDSLNRERCLDWRDICNGEIDCINGDDENQCMNFEMNICDIEMEFRCRNGLCIRREFLFDGQFDCLDGSDEQLKLNEKLCYQFPFIDCEEHLCNRNQFSCGDGQCITWIEHFQESVKCMNGNDMFYMCESKLMEKTLKDGSCKEERLINQKPLSCIDEIHRYVISRNEIEGDLKSIKSDLSFKCKTVNQSLLYYIHSYFFSPFINAYITSEYINEFIQSDDYSFSLFPDKFCFGNLTNQCVTSKNLFKYKSIPFDNLFQIKLEKDPCQEYPQYFYQCSNSIECISKYRLFDGYADCLDGSDEINNQFIDERFLQDRYQCKTIPKKIMLHLLGQYIIMSSHPIPRC